MITKNIVAEETYEGVGLNSSFPISFPTWNETDIVAFVNRQSDGVTLTLNYGEDFTLTEKRDELILVNSGKEWLDVDGNLAAGYILFIQFDPNAAQLAKFTDLGRTAPIKFEGALDRLAMTLKSVKDLASRALSFGGGSGTNSELPPLVGNAGRILKINADEDGIDYGPDVQDIFDARDEAQAAAVAAGTSEDNAALSAGDSATSASQALTSRNQAQTFAQNASDSAQAADLSAQNASTYEQEAERWAHLFAFSGLRVITAADSPVTVDYVTNEGEMFLVDTTDGPVRIDLPNLSSMPNSNWKFGITKVVDNANNVTVYPFAGQTIGNGANLTLSKVNVGIAFHDNTPTNWESDYLVMGSFGDSGGSGLPVGGVDGDFIRKNSNLEGDAVWQSGTFTGFSARFNEAFNEVGLRETILKILNLSYLGPQVSLSASGNGTIREKGTAVTASTLTANVTMRSDPIARIRFFLDGVLQSDMNPPSNTGSGATTYNWSGSFQDNVTFSVTVTDDGASGGPTNASASAAFTFVYPYYHGCRAPGATAAQVAGLTKSVIASNANLLRSFTAANGDVFYFAYPASYGALTSILDQNGFETILSWNARTENITGLDGNPVAYRIYEFQNVQSANAANFTFKR